MSKIGEKKKTAAENCRTEEEKKRFLESYRVGLKELERFRAEYEMAEELARILSGGITEQARQTAKELKQEEERLCGVVHRTLEIKRAIEAKIEAVPNGTRSLILKYRYIDGKSWDEISEELNYSWRNLHYMHKKALEDIAI